VPNSLFRLTCSWRIKPRFTRKPEINEEFWVRRSAEWHQEEHQIRSSLKAIEAVQPERYLNAARILELANKAYSLYVRQDHAEKPKLLKMVLSNCGIDAVSLFLERPLI
jgi:hypothetical protein